MGGYALGNSDLDACGEHGNIDSEVCDEDPLIYPLPNLTLGVTECEIWEGVCKYSFSVLGTYFYIVKQRMGTRILKILQHVVWNMMGITSQVLNIFCCICSCIL